VTEPTSPSPLTAALLQELIAQAPALARQADALLAPVASRRDGLRESLHDGGEIHLIGPLTGAPVSLAAVDGGSVREHLYAADLMVAVAAAADGMTSTAGLPLGHRHWTVVRPHESENDRLLSAAMAALELSLLADLDHDVRLLDGSHGTPIIALSTALSARSAAVQQAAAQVCTEQVLAAVDALSGRDPNRTVVALPKADSAHAFADLYQERYGLHLPGGDRFLAAQVLQPGEMLAPRKATELASLHVPVPDRAPADVQDLCGRLDRAIAPIRQAAQAGTLRVTYLKPASCDTVIKVEFHGDDAQAAHIARLLSDETPGPFLQEPFAQYAVDLAAKSVAVGADALNQAMLANLPDGADAYATLLARSYRTKNVTGPARPAAPAAGR
jgi:hypothetical protein